MTRFVLLLLIGLANCTNQSTLEPALSDVLEADAWLYGNGLPADGCEARFLLSTDATIADPRPFQRIPTEATRSLMDKVVLAEGVKIGNTLWMGSKRVRIRYRETGQTGILQCGWGARQDVKTIELLEVK